MTKTPKRSQKDVAVATARMPEPRRQLWACFASALLAPPAVAQDELLTEADWLFEVPKVESATRQRQDITQAPSSITIITRDMIEALGARNVAEVMRLVPGFQAFYSNGSTFGVTPHGFSDRDPRRMEVRVNGRSVYLPQLSSVAWESLGLLPDDIDHIEVVRGSNVPAYGSNAILGAVNIITRNPVKVDGGQLKVTYGSVDTRIVSAKQHFVTDTMNLSLRTASKESDGFKDVPDEAQVGHLVLSGVYTPSLSSTVDFEVGISDGEFGTGDGDHLDEFADDEREALWLSGNWQYTGAESQLWKFHFSHADYQFDRSRKVWLSEQYELTDTEIATLFPGHVDELLEQAEGKRDFSVTSVELEHHLQLGQHWKTIWGLGSRMDRLKSQQLLDSDDYVDTTVYYLFGNAEWKLNPSWALNVGLMLEEQAGFNAEVSPRLALNYHINPRHHLRVGATRAYRQPALLESDRMTVARFANGDLIDLVRSSHPDIDSEQVDTIEAGYIGYWLDGALSLDAKIFREDIHGAIDLVDNLEGHCLNPTTPEVEWLADKYCIDYTLNGEYGGLVSDKIRVIANTADWDVEGVEMQLTWQLNPGTMMRLDYTFLDTGGERYRKVRPVSNLSLLIDKAPEQSTAFLFSHQLSPNWQVSGFLQYTDFLDWRDGTEVDAHTRLDLNLKRAWRWGNTEGEVALVVQNANNEAYLEYQRNNLFERRAFVSVTMRWP